MTSSRTSIAGLFAAVVTVAVVAAACGGQTHASSGANAAVLGATSAPSQAGGGEGGANGAGPADSGGSAPSQRPALLDDTRSVIRTADITVQVPELSAADRVRSIAEKAGGVVDGDDRSSGATSTATITLEVPPASLGAVLTQIAALGKEKSRSSTSKDVTAQVVDVDSRVKSAQDSIDRLRLLFRQATKLGDIISLESELSQREADLESLEAQQRTLAAQTSMAKVTAYLSTVAAVVAAKHHRERGGFVGGLTRGWHGFTTTVRALLTGFGLVGPFLVVLIALGAAGTLLRRRRRSALPAPEPAPGPAS